MRVIAAAVDRVKDADWKKVSERSLAGVHRSTIHRCEIRQGAAPARCGTGRAAAPIGRSVGGLSLLACFRRLAALVADFQREILWR
jgi:hypothetical protein